MSIFYRYLLCCLYVLQHPWDAFNLWREREKIIAGCKYEIGQLTNVLNYFFDSTLNRIYITQEGYLNVFVPTFTHAYTPPPADESDVFVLTFGTPIMNNEVLIHVPAPYYTPLTSEYTALVGVIEQIKITGLNYQIVSI
jgi:hypothetical protein